MKTTKKILILSTLVLGLSANLYANDGAKGKTLAVKKEYSTSGNPNYISGKKEAIKKISAIFNYAEDNSYQIFLKEDFITTIKLEANEDILYIAGGNIEGVMLDQTRGGKDGSSLVYIKPLFEDLDTNIVITTDKRVYYFDVKTSKTMFNPMIRFNYPMEREIVAYANESAVARINNPITMADIEAKKYETTPYIPTTVIKDVNYEIRDNNDIAPDLVYNDGLKTYVRLKKGIQEMPILEVLGEDGKPEKVNQRIEEKDGYKFFIVDKLFDKGQTKLGNKVGRFSKIK
jgi:conjugal transfer protein trbG/virB9/cagX